MQSSRPSDRQLAIVVSVAVGIVVAVITTATFWWVYDLTLGRAQRVAAQTAGARWSPSDGIKVITSSPAVTPTDGRQNWMGRQAWNEGVQAGQAWIQQYPNTVNVQVLVGMSSAQVWTYMQQYVSGALGVGCQYCHNINNFSSDEYPQKVAARNMLRLVRDVNAEFIVNLPNWQGNYVQCATCHNNAPNNLEGFGTQFINSVPPIKVTVDPLDTNGMAILDPAQKPEAIREPVLLKDAILFYIYNYQVWKPFDPNEPESGRGSLALTYDGGRTQDQVTINQNVMNYQAWSLGVGCTFCHNSRNFAAYELNPAGDNVLNPVYAYNKLKAQRMLLLTTWLAENWPRYGAIAKPEIPTGSGAASRYSYQRLGDGQIYNVPGCYTCHRGNNIPLASINQANIPSGDAGTVVLPPQLRGR
ncbi:cytochrome c-554 Puf2C [Chloroflexus sp.]|uniref:cytochrome c-554 Puf2C n=1 Tax=Chloroflexus sp. TaxID=1904827 RepID=UPI002ADE66EE|nr:cytochrome c-554 Puf2C [Chloroflexus sp.]